MVDYDPQTWNDLSRWTKLVGNKNLSSDELEKLHDEIIKTNDVGLAYFCALEFPYKSYRLQNIIINNKNVYYAYLFAKDIENADIKSLQNIVIHSKNMDLITKFACFVNGSDNKIIEKLVIKSGVGKYAHMLLKHVKHIHNRKRLRQIILLSAKPRYLFELAKYANKKDIVIIEDLIIKSGNFTYIRLLAGKVKIANVEKLEQAVLDSSNSEEIKKFAKYVKKSRMRHFMIVA